MLLLCSSTYSFPYSFYMYLIVSLAMSRQSILLTLSKVSLHFPYLCAFWRQSDCGKQLSSRSSSLIKLNMPPSNPALCNMQICSLCKKKLNPLKFKLSSGCCTNLTALNGGPIISGVVFPHLDSSYNFFKKLCPCFVMVSEYLDQI